MNFYNIPANLASEPSLIVVSDLDDVNIPLPREKLFLNLQDDKDKILYLLEKLQLLTEKPPTKLSQGVPLGAMINNAVNLMAPRSGRVIVFTSTLPVIGMGKLSAKKVDPKLFGTDNEKQFY